MIRAEDKARRLRWKEKWDRWRQLKAKQHAGEMLSEEDFEFVKSMDQARNAYIVRCKYKSTWHTRDNVVRGGRFLH